MTSEATKVFRAHWLAKAFPLVVMAVGVEAVLFAPGERTLTGVIFFGCYFLLCGVLAAHIFTAKAIFTEEEVRVENFVFGSSAIQYEEIDRIESTHLFYIVEIYRSSEPVVSIGVAIKGLQEMLTELIERAPDDVEIVDPMGRLGSIVHHDTN